MCKGFDFSAKPCALHLCKQAFKRLAHDLVAQCIIARDGQIVGGFSEAKKFDCFISI